MESTIYENYLKGHTNSINCLCICESIINAHFYYNADKLTKGVLASGSDDNSIRIWDLNTDKYWSDKVNMPDKR
jgi:WD40 repeat protein